MEASSLPSRRLILLGCGYVGRQVAVEALGRGWQVSALTRNPAKAAELRATLGLTVVEGDLSTDDWHAALDPQGAWVVDCVSSGGGGEAGYRQAYLEGARSIGRWLRARGPARGLLYTGSTSVYPQTGGEWIDETAPTEATTPLNAVLLETEAVFAALAAEGLAARVAVVRLVGLYGPGRHYLLDQLRRGEVTFAGPGDYYLNLLHRDDAATALLTLAEAEEAATWRGFAVLNASDGAPALKATIAEWTAAQLDLPTPTFLPDAPNARMQRRLLASGGVPNRRIAARRLVEEFGWKPRYPDFRAGYREFLDALR